MKLNKAQWPTDVQIGLKPTHKQKKLLPFTPKNEIRALALVREKVIHYNVGVK